MYNSKGDIQWEIIFYSSFIGYTFHTGCKVLCNKHVHILVQQIIILNAISMVDHGIYFYILYNIFMWFLSSFIQFWKHQNYEWISWEFFWKVKQMFWISFSFYKSCQKSSHNISRGRMPRMGSIFFTCSFWKNSRKFYPDRKGIVNEKPPWYKQTRTSTLAAGYT